MALEAAVTFSNGVKGDNTKKGRDGTSVVIEFNHNVKSPSDMHTGAPTSARVHEPVTFVKPIDQASPQLYQHLCENKYFPEVTFAWYTVNPKTGSEDMYFQTVLRNARIVSVEQVIPNTKDPSLEKLVHMEKVAMAYEKINWMHMPTNIEYTDAWRDPLAE